MPSYEVRTGNGESARVNRLDMAKIIAAEFVRLGARIAIVWDADGASVHTEVSA